jgi:protein-tyrosine phosphatase
VDEGSSREKIGALLHAGITALDDLTEEGDLLSYSGLIDAAASHRRFPVRDVSAPESPAVAAAALDAIDRGIEGGGRMYAYCWGGVGRTGGVVGCWLARPGFPGEAALVRLRELWRQCTKSRRRQSPDTREQERYVLRWTEAGQP